MSEPFHGKDLGEVVAVIVKNDSRYDRAAYDFIRVALDHTNETLAARDTSRKNPHVSGHELLEGIREYALKQYGPMAMPLFEAWGVRSGHDFGEIVFNLVEYGVFGKTDSDSIHDFDDCYDFREAFVEPFLPPSRKGGKEQRS